VEHKRTLIVLLIASFIASFVASCAGKPLYYWGHYEDVIYSKFNENASPLNGIELLLDDKKRASTKGLPLPPGFHSHLGMLFYEVGNYSMANEEFLVEKKNFLESSVLMNRFLKINGSKKQ